MLRLGFVNILSSQFADFASFCLLFQRLGSQILKIINLCGVARQAVDHHITRHLQCWQHLAHNCQQMNQRLFRLRPKCHYLHHIGKDIRRNQLNCRIVSACFYDESFLGYIKRIATACHSSSMIKTRFWQRYFILLAIRWEQTRRCVSTPT